MGHRMDLISELFWISLHLEFLGQNPDFFKLVIECVRTLSSNFHLKMREKFKMLPFGQFSSISGLVWTYESDI